MKKRLDSRLIPIFGSHFLLFGDPPSLLKITEKIIRENAFKQKEKVTQVKMNHGLSANRPSNNWAQGLKRKKWLALPPKTLQSVFKHIATF